MEHSNEIVSSNPTSSPTFQDISNLNIHIKWKPSTLIAFPTPAHPEVKQSTATKKPGKPIYAAISPDPAVATAIAASIVDAESKYEPFPTFGHVLPIRQVTMNMEKRIVD